jgi:hypothetical protein
MKCRSFTLGMILVVLFTRFASPTVSAGPQGEGRALWRAIARLLASAGQSLRAAAAGVCALLLLGVSVPANAQSISFTGVQTTVGSGLSNPAGVAVDRAGDVFIADYGHNRVAEVPAGDGTQTTVGSGLIGPAGVAWSNFTKTRLHENAINVAENPKN